MLFKAPVKTIDKEVATIKELLDDTSAVLEGYARQKIYDVKGNKTLSIGNIKVGKVFSKLNRVS